MTLFGKSADQEDGGLVSQGTALTVRTEDPFTLKWEGVHLVVRKLLGARILCPCSYPCRSVNHATISVQQDNCYTLFYNFFSSVQSLSHVLLFVTPWTAACKSSLSITNAQSLLKLMSIESVMPSNHLILCLPLLLPPSIFPSIRVFSNESVLHIMWPEYWSFSFSISPSSEYSGFFSFRIDWFDLLVLQRTIKSLLCTTV